MNVSSSRRLSRRGLLGLGVLAAGAVTLALVGTSTASQQAGQQHHNGHEKIQHPSKLPNGSHTLHTNPSGHTSSVQVQSGKITGMNVRAPNTQPVQVRYVVQQGWIAFVFYDAWHNVWVYYWFPVEWVYIV
jgi:hypothetical protein